MPDKMSEEITEAVNEIVERNLFETAFQQGLTAGIQRVQSFLCRSCVDAMKAGDEEKVAAFNSALKLVDDAFGEPDHLNGVNVIKEAGQ